MTLFWHISSWNVILSWLRKESRLCMSLAALGDSRSLLQNLSDALMPWDAGVVQPLFTLPSWSLALLGAMTGPDLCHPGRVSTPVQPVAPYLQLPALLPSCYFFLPLLCFSSFVLGLASGEFGFVIRTSACKLAQLLLSFGCGFPWSLYLPVPQAFKTYLVTFTLPGCFLFIFLLGGSLDYQQLVSSCDLFLPLVQLKDHSAITWDP